jgi:glycosyltransferase involved in cell wall biosynthesis
MNLLFVTASLTHGGAERHTITLVNRLAERGHECHLAYLKDDAAQIARLRGAASVQCMEVRRYLDLRALGRLAALARRLQPHHVVAVNTHALLYARLAARGVPLAVNFHTTEFLRTRDALKMLYYRPFFWSADRVVFVCEAQRRYWRRRRVFGRRNDVIHNGIDIAHWAPVAEASRRAVRRALGIGERDYVIAMSAVLRPEKNPLQLLEAVAALRARGIPARALLIGDGPMRAAVEARAARLGMVDHVMVTGLQSDVRPLLGASDVVALCSTAIETFSLSALEAMALGRPVVQSEIGGAAEMTRPGIDGWLFPVGDTRALVERLAALSDPAPRLAMGRAAREAVEQRFAEPAMVERYEAALSELAIPRRKDGNLRKPAGAH